MIVLHHLEKSRSHRVLWMLEELQLEYRVEIYRRHPQTLLAPERMKAVHPLGKSPVLSIDGEVVAESGAILEYLAERYPDRNLAIGPGDEGRLDYLYWLHYAEGSLMPPLVMKLVFGRLSKPPVPWLMRPIAKRLGQGVTKAFLQPQIDTHLAFLESWLQRRNWLAGDRFTAADIQIGYVLEAADGPHGRLRAYPSLQGYLQRLRTRSAYRLALEKGGPVAI